MAVTMLQPFYDICVVEGGKKSPDISFISSYSFLGKEAFEKFRLTELLFNADDEELHEACVGCSPPRTVCTKEYKRRS